MDEQNSVYAPRPWSTSQEQQVTNYLKDWVEMPTDAVRRIAPPIPNIGRTPPRFGYRQHVLGIQDIARLDEVYPGSRVDYSQRQSGYSATSTPALGGF
ncbi:hypothetical protein [Saccharothrix sp. ST-888]|uniref:hypothetical protein n=1 Tax=Saccharothrix sp. ST-888 TaxID=1427391 RepID=UPI0005ECF837|nr:hypothetical protein [Saccharothrix sp. ST-888]KJK56228.1 hypothetical protein UK12_23890 [Saccharothrix sp. ST-888]